MDLSYLSQQIGKIAKGLPSPRLSDIYHNKLGKLESENFIMTNAFIYFRYVICGCAPKNFLDYGASCGPELEIRF